MNPREGWSFTSPEVLEDYIDWIILNKTPFHFLQLHSFPDCLCVYTIYNNNNNNIILYINETLILIQF